MKVYPDVVIAEQQDIWKQGRDIAFQQSSSASTDNKVTYNVV